ncbi:hypothetical protein BACCAP_04432 [Pseudoflavonifractor capillosus ATCC 29799]|uniref:Uncharacterized protein n=1 Tax=Pseudoflavonifractor capillosus ATCC 29799 TaxID=411467 RepID=A6P1R0_9FIRM|nr:hypothetical protein BACCAP_04432 [Pseudoflavonifractor capillosus ATCC 29799]
MKQARRSAREQTGAFFPVLACRVAFREKEAYNVR